MSGLIDLLIIYVFTVAGACMGFFSGFFLVILHTWFMSRLVDTVVIPVLYGLMFLVSLISTLLDRDIASISFLAGWVLVSIYVVIPILREILNPPWEIIYEEQPQDFYD